MNTRPHSAERYSPSADRTAVMRQLNDALRQTGRGGRLMATVGVAALPEATQQAAFAALRAFVAFDPGNDPYGEHDFGRFACAGQAFLFKVDAYDRDMTHASPDPANPAVTCRVLTLMLAEEY